MRRFQLFAVLLSFFAPGPPVAAQLPSDCYRVENLSTPDGVYPAVSALTFARDGRLYACFRFGSIWSLDTDTRQWRKFATGLFWPLGILEGNDGEFYVAQVPELTRVADTDGDGEADVYETVCDRWGLSGNYHEFVSGPVRDEEGNFYVGLGCASSSGPLRQPMRGARSALMEGIKSGHISPVAYRGWVVKITPAGSLEPFASGFRQPNGIGLNRDGDLFVADNQGDWKGTSPIYHVEKGNFYGHPASLVWESDFSGNPLKLSTEKLQERRTLPAIRIPQNDMAGSITQPANDTTEGKFGPYADQFIVAEWTFGRLHRVAFERVDGAYQGACFPFVSANGLRRGSNRLAFAPDGSLYLGQVSHLWGGEGEGLQRVVWTGKLPFDILRVQLTTSGFELVLTKPVDRRTAVESSSYALKHYDYLYHEKYGSPKIHETLVEVTRVEVSDDALRVRLEVKQLVPRRVYELRAHGVRSTDGEPLASRMAAYTLNRLREKS